MLLVCLDKLRVAAAQAVFVGDSTSDRDAADAAGIHFVACGNPALDAPGVSSLRELPAFLSALKTGASEAPF
jgi:phosphoglycolate phosphatase-like HAD superfamily hydrolase